MKSTNPINIFIIYSREDKSLLNKLKKQLKPLEQSQLIKLWFDGKIKIGKKWKDEINKALHAADIILILVSSDFFYSNYAYEIEMTQALNRHDKGITRVIPIILRDCLWKDSPLGNLQVIPEDGIPVTDTKKWPSIDKGFYEIAINIRKVCCEIKLKEANQFFSNEKYDQAKQNYKEALKYLERINSIGDKDINELNEKEKIKKSIKACNLKLEANESKEEFKKHIKLAEYAIKQNNSKKAISEYKQAISFYQIDFLPNKLEIENLIKKYEREINYSEHLKKAEELKTKKDYQNALKYFRNALNLKPSPELEQKITECKILKKAIKREKRRKQLSKASSVIPTKKVFFLLPLFIFIIWILPFIAKAWDAFHKEDSIENWQDNYDEVIIYNQDYYIIKKGIYWGVVDTAGKELIDPIYEEFQGGIKDTVLLRRGSEVFRLLLPLGAFLPNIPVIPEINSDSIDTKLEDNEQIMQQVENQELEDLDYSNDDNGPGLFDNMSRIFNKNKADSLKKMEHDERVRQQNEKMKVKREKKSERKKFFKKLFDQVDHISEEEQSLNYPIDKMIKIQGGSFEMGCTEEQGDDCEVDEKPIHKVTVKTFYMSSLAVTNEQYAIFLNKKGYYQERWIDLKKSRILKISDKYKVEIGYEKYPVVYVSWYGAKAYAESYGLRLPTEAEWEFAARGGNLSKRYRFSGSNNLIEVGWYESNSSNALHPVGRKQPNELELYDMSGNVWEWCKDGKRTYTSSNEINPKMAVYKDIAVIRGSAWSNNLNECHISNRSGQYILTQEYYIGFRCVKD